MENEDKKYGMLDDLITDALEDGSFTSVPGGLTARVMRKIEKPDILKELAFESTMKVGLVIATFVILTTTFLVLGIADIHTVGIFMGKYRAIIFPVAVLILFTWLFNDIILKYMFRRSGIEGGSDGVMEL